MPLARLLVSLLLAIALTTGCTVRLVSDYDEVTDQGVQDLYRKVDRFFIRMESATGTEQAAYAKHVEFYHDVEADIDTLKLRASIKEHNELTLGQLDKLAANVELLRAAHEKAADRGPGKAFLKRYRTMITDEVADILKLEHAKRAK